MPAKKPTPKAASRKPAVPRPVSSSPSVPSPSKVEALPSRVTLGGPLGLAPLHHHHWTRWTYLAFAAVAIVTLGIGTFALTNFEPTPKPSPVTPGMTQQPAADTPFAADLAGGNRYVHGHFYPVAVMVDNHSAARPQSGLQAASVVYEALVEGGITRFMAVLDQGDVPHVGPVRSARPYYLEWLAEYDAIYAHAGGSPEALTNIRRDRVHDLNGIGNAAVAFKRDTLRPAPHNLYASSLGIAGFTKKLNLKYDDAEITPWVFGDTLATGSVVKAVALNFSGSAKSTAVRYTYDATRSQWLRTQAGQPHNDRLTGKQIGVTNLVVQRISRNIAVGEKGRLSMTVTGTGIAKIFQRGQVLDATWSKPTREARTTFTLADGTPVTFLPGNTWVAVLPEDRTLTTE